MRLNKVIMTGLIAIVLVLTGCDSPGVSKTLGDVKKMNLEDVSLILNPDEVYAIKEMTVLGLADDESIAIKDLLKEFEIRTNTKVISGNVSNFKDLKVRDLTVLTGRKIYFEQSTVDERKVVSNYIDKYKDQPGYDLMNITIGQVLTKAN